MQAKSAEEKFGSGKMDEEKEIKSHLMNPRFQAL